MPRKLKDSDIGSLVRNCKGDASKLGNAIKIAGGSGDDISYATNLFNSQYPSGGTNVSGINFGGGNQTGGGVASGIIGGLKSAFDIVNNVVKGVADVAGQVVSTQMGQGDDRGPKAIEAILDVVKNGGLNPISLIQSGAGEVFDQIKDQLTQESQLRSEINSKTMLTGQLSQDLRRDMVESSIAAAKYGMDVTDISKMYVQLVENSGKFSLINKKFIESALPVAKALSLTTDELANYISEFEQIGAGATDTIKEISDATTRSVSLGLNARKIADDMKTNIGLLNQYGFKNGVQGLERMVQTAREFRMDLKDIQSIAEKVFNPEGAVEMSARLQVLGGAMGDFANPMKLMYDATNNVEGLQDSLIGAARALVTYNEGQKRFEITGANLRRSKEMADAMGISMGELNKMAIASAERFQATQSLAASALDLKDSDKEFLTNLSRMENGKMTIEVPESIAQRLGVPTEIALDKLDANTAKALLENKKDFEKMSPADMADKQLTATQSMARDMAVVAQYYRVRAAQMIGGVIQGTNVQKLQQDLRNQLEGRVEDIKKESNPNLQDRIAQRIREANIDLTKPIESAKMLQEIIKSETNRGQKSEQEQTTANQTPQTVTIIHKHEFGAQPSVMSGIGRELQKDPEIWNEWTSKQIPQLAKRQFAQ